MHTCGESRHCKYCRSQLLPDAAANDQWTQSRRAGLPARGRPPLHCSRVGLNSPARYRARALILRPGADSLQSKSHPLPWAPEGSRSSCGAASAARRIWLVRVTVSRQDARERCKLCARMGPGADARHLGSPGAHEPSGPARAGPEVTESPRWPFSSAPTPPPPLQALSERSPSCVAHRKRQT